ncbi:cytochrome P450 [Streptomyces sp. CA-253872]|uniref:cytochrome P450 n=1 Tax=Streptomyces sp. CA-253872 TaxID=3240067 RepID=UPI003D8AF51E
MSPRTPPTAPPAGTARTAPLAAGALPLLGHAPALARGPLPFLEGLRAHGEIVRIALGPKQVLAVCAPDLVGTLLTRPEFTVGGPLWDTLEILLGKGVATSNGPRHRRQRRTIQPAFRPDRIASYARVMTEEAVRTAESWRDGEITDVGAEMFRTGVRIVSRSLLEVDARGTELADRIAHALHTVFGGLYQRMVLSFGPLHRLPTPANRRFNAALAELHTLVRQLVRDARANDSGDAAPDDDLLSVLLHATDENGAPLPDEEIHDNVVSLVVAAAENVAATLAWTFHLLAQHPEWERRLRAEVESVAPDRPVDFEDLPKLALTRNLLSESMRIRPAAWIFTRRAANDTELGGYRVPAGTDVLYSPWALQHDARSFPEPHRFDPDRWLPERAADIPRHAFIPFGIGNRKCPGDIYSLTELALVLANTVRHWHVEAVPGRTDPRPRIGITLQPRATVLRVRRA